MCDEGRVGIRSGLFGLVRIGKGWFVFFRVCWGWSRSEWRILEPVAGNFGVVATEFSKISKISMLVPAV